MKLGKETDFWGILRLIFIKKINKTPQSEIDLSKKYRADYLKREGECHE